MMVAWNALPPYPEWSDDWAAVWEEHLAGNEPYLLEWFRHQTDADVLAQRLGGRDRRPHHVPGVPDRRLARRLPEPAAAAVREAAGARRRCSSGRGITARPTPRIPGPAHRPPARGRALARPLVQGAANGVMDEPPVVVFMQEGHDPDPDRLESEGAWRAETLVAGAGCRRPVLYLQEGRAARGRSREPTAPTSCVYDPTVGVTAGLWSAGLPFGLPGDQRPDEALVAHLHHRRPGRGSAHARPAASRAAGGVIDERDRVRRQPQRRALRTGPPHSWPKGMLNVTRRDSLREPAALPPGERAVLADRPRRHGLGLPPRPSHPRRGRECRLAERVADACAGDEPCAPRPGLARFHFAADRARRTERRDAGLPALARRRPATRRGGQAADLAGLAATFSPARRKCSSRSRATSVSTTRRAVQRTYEGTMRVNRDDPARASAFGRHTASIIRPSGTTTSKSDLTIQATAERFHIVITLEVDQNGANVFRRSWIESMRREML